MKSLVNEKGSTLLLTLIIIAMFTILGTTLITANLNQTKQVYKSDELLQSTNLSEMGIIYFKRKVYNYIQINRTTITPDKLVNWITTNYSANPQQVPIPDSTDSTSLYKFIVRDVVATKTDSTSVVVTFESIGITNGNVEGKTIHGDISIGFHSGGPGSPGGPVGDGSNWGPGDTNNDGQPDWIIDPTNVEHEPYNGNYRFTNPITLDENGNNPTTTITGNAMFDQKVDFSNPQNSLIITEDAFFNGAVSLNKVDSNILVYGNAKFDGTVDYLSTHSTIEIGEDAIFTKDFSMQDNHSDLLVYGSAVFNSITINNNHSVIDVREDAQFNGDVKIQANNDGKMSIGCSAIFVGSFELLSKNIVTIGGNATFYRTMKLAESGETTVTIGNNSIFRDVLTVDQGNVVINGSALFLKSPITQNNGKITILGNLYLDGVVPSGVTFTGNKLPTNQYPDYPESLVGSFTCSAPTSGGGGEIDMRDNTTY